MREIFKHAILSNATFIMCFHNHPSGIPEESREDIEITKRLDEAGNLLGIGLLDHIIIGEGKCHVSLREKGIIKNRGNISGY
jgi:DNA repair protein RadC